MASALHAEVCDHGGTPEQAELGIGIAHIYGK